MSGILIGVIVFGIIFGAALFGMFLGRVLPNQHLSPDARDVIRVTMAMLATLSALVLGLFTGSAMNSLAEKEGELRNAGVQFIVLDRTLASYGPETKEARDLLKQLLSERISQIWPEEGGGTVALGVIGGGTGIDSVQQNILALSPETDAQRWLQSTALQITNTLAVSRWKVVEQIDSRFPWPFFIVVVSWLAIIFASFGLFAPPNASVTAAFFVAALALSGSIFMILEMDQPYDGMIKIPSTSWRIALDQLGRT